MRRRDATATNGALPGLDLAYLVAEAVDRRVNYFDLVPFCGNAQERLGLGLKSDPLFPLQE